MNIKAATKTYEVRFESDFSFVRKLADTPNAFFVVDQNVWDLYQDELSVIPENALYKLEAVESNKVIETALSICESMVQMNAKRNAHLISLGGGITQDVTGFAANILYRGIAWTFVPTTLLAACDSCIGGKTSLNYKSYKNLLGTFFPPDVIHICPLFFKTLSRSDLESGLGEVVKFNVMGGSQTLGAIESALPDLLDLEAGVVNAFVHNSLDFKKSIIEEDEFDGGKRVLLNFAHTFGHAFEASSEYRIPHGSAVALGMVSANAVSRSRGMLGDELDGRVKVLVKAIMPAYAPSLIRDEAVLAAIRKDKKQVGEQLTAVLMDNGQDLYVVHDMTENEVRIACDAARDFLAGIEE